ncbi:unnamed protein product [Penicillium pancosmium]
MIRNRLREEFALSFAEWPKSLRSLCLQYTGNRPENHNISPFIRSVAGNDFLSLTVNALSQQLETNWLLSVSIGPETFWPPIQKTQPYWPRLSHFELVYTAATQSGQWLFDKDPRWREHSPDESDDGSSDDYDSAPQDHKPDLIRSMPLDTIRDIYIAAGDAARQMPQLKTMELEDSIPGIDGLEDVLGCCPSHGFKYDRPSGAATWISSSEFHVTERMREAWDAAAKAHGHFQVNIENFKDYDHLGRWDD